MSIGMSFWPLTNSVLVSAARIISIVWYNLFRGSSGSKWPLILIIAVCQLFSLFIFILVVIRLSTQMWNLDMKIVYLVSVVISLENFNCCLIHHGMNGLCTYSCRKYKSKQLLSLLWSLNFDHIFPHLWNSYPYEG